jgi:hypothetical protein
VEEDTHLFFHCHLPRAVWFSADPPLRTDNLPHEDDGVQLILQAIISNSTPNTLFIKILITMWYLWKARNDIRFQRQSWTPWQVHHAVSAQIALHIQALQPGNNITPETAASSGNRETTDRQPNTNGTGMPSVFAGNVTAPNNGPTRENSDIDSTSQGTNFANADHSAPSTNHSQASRHPHPHRSLVQPTQSGTLLLNSGNTPTTIQAHRQLTMLLERLIAHCPTKLQGSRRYSDASTLPGMPRSIPRNAGIGVFIINTQVQPPQQVYIKATMKDFTSVLMAEAAALALATTVCS